MSWASGCGVVVSSWNPSLSFENAVPPSWLREAESRCFRLWICRMILTHLSVAWKYWKAMLTEFSHVVSESTLLKGLIWKCSNISSPTVYERCFFIWAWPWKGMPVVSWNFWKQGFPDLGITRFKIPWHFRWRLVLNCFFCCDCSLFFVVNHHLVRLWWWLLRSIKESQIYVNQLEINNESLPCS